ncbi:glycosyltransferase family 2 protein [Candidatus Neomarinimicrobiota bacterium]
MIAKIIYKVKSQLLYHLSMKRKVDTHNDIKLGMTLLVKNEADIIEMNINNHLNQGVDIIVALDDNSTDRTPIILKNLADKGLLYLVDYPKTKYTHAGMVNYLGNIATSKYKADLIFHCDADELWVSSTGNIKQEMINHPFVTGLHVPIINVLLKEDNGHEKFPNDAIYHVVNPMKINNDSDKSMTDFFLQEYPAKVLYTVRNGYLEVEQGNHEFVLSKNKKPIMVKSKDITIFHFPIRGKQQFYAKILKAKHLIKKENPSGETSWHWKSWIKEFDEGNFNRLYKSLILSEKNAKILIDKKIVQVRVFREINFGSLKKY